MFFFCACFGSDGVGPLKNFSHPGARYRVPVWVARGSASRVSCCECSPFCGVLLSSGVSCAIGTSDGVCACSGVPILWRLVVSLVDESSESGSDVSLGLSRLFDGYLPFGGVYICGMCCFGHILCHSGGDMGPNEWMSVIFHSSPMCLV